MVIVYILTLCAFDVCIQTRRQGYAVLSVIFSCPSSSRPTLVTHSLTHSLCFIHCVGFKAFQPSRPNPNLEKLMGIMRKHDLANKETITKTDTKTTTMTNTFSLHLQRAIFETFYLWDVWSEWWGNMTWPTRQQQRQRQWWWQIHLENTPKERLLKTFREHHQITIPENLQIWPFQTSWSPN